MSITIDIDEETIRKAKAAMNIYDTTELFRRLLEREIRANPPPVAPTSQRNEELARRIAAMGGTMPDMPKPFESEDARNAEIARRIAALGGSMPDIEMPRRRRVEDYM